jgi:hypothetical protein
LKHDIKWTGCSTNLSLDFSWKKSWKNHSGRKKNHVQFDRRLWRDCRMQYLSAHHKFHILLTCSMPPLQMLLMRVQDVSAS